MERGAAGAREGGGAGGLAGRLAGRAEEDGVRAEEGDALAGSGV